MEYLVTLFLGLLLGLLVLYILQPGFFVKNPREFQTLETMFEQFMEEMDEKQEAWRDEYLRCCEHLALMESRLQKAAAASSGQAQPDVVNKTTTAKADSQHRVLSQIHTIESLAEQDVPVSEIAQRLGLGTGEVSLVLGLKNHRHNS